jgi:hypothetical protein
MFSSFVSPTRMSVHMNDTSISVLSSTALAILINVYSPHYPSKVHLSERGKSGCNLRRRTLWQWRRSAAQGGNFAEDARLGAEQSPPRSDFYDSMRVTAQTSNRRWLQLPFTTFTPSISIRLSCPAASQSGLHYTGYCCFNAGPTIRKYQIQRTFSSLLLLWIYNPLNKLPFLSCSLSGLSRPNCFLP